MAFYSVSGYVKKGDGTAIPGIKLKLVSPSGSSSWVETDYRGYYVFPSVEQKSGNYLLTPSRNGAVFTPASRSFVVDGNKTKDFTAAAVSSAYKSFSGKIIGAPGASIRVKRRHTGGSVYIWTYSNPTTGEWKIWWAASVHDTFEVSAEDPAGVYTFSAAQTVSFSGSDITGINFTATGGAIVGYDLYGYVRDGGGIGQSGILVSVMGLNHPAEITCITDGAGEYRIQSAEPDTYTIVPSFEGATFAPTSGSATVVNMAVHGTDFVITYGVGTYSISGTLSGMGASHTSMTVFAVNTTTSAIYTGISAGAGTDPRTYSINGVPNGTYSVYPGTIPGGSWSSALTVTVSSANATGVNFTFTAGSTGAGSIAGTVTLDGIAMPGVTLELRTGTATSTDPIAELTSNASGQYIFESLANNTYNVVPVMAGYVFYPTKCVVAISGAASTGNDFAATLAGGSTTDTFSISGKCYQGIDTGVPGVLVTAGTRSATSDAYGNYIITNVPIGTYTLIASLSGYAWQARFTNPVTVAYGNLTDCNFLGTGSTGGGGGTGGGGSDLAVPYVFTDAHDYYTEAITGAKHNANNDYICDHLANITDGQIAEGAGIDSTKIGSSLGKANLAADIKDLDDRLSAFDDMNVEFVQKIHLPVDEEGMVISGSAAKVTIEAGKHLLLAGKRFEISGTYPKEGTLSPQSVYALRARLVTADDVKDDSSLKEGELYVYLVPLAGNCLKSGETGSRRFTVAEITGTFTTTKMTISGQGSAPLLGAFCVCLDASYEKFFIAYNSASTIMLADPLGAEPADHSRIGICIDDPDYIDNPGEFGGCSTADDALLAIVWQGTAGQAPYIQKMIRQSYEIVGQHPVIDTGWCDRVVLSDVEALGYDEVQWTIPAMTTPVVGVTLVAALYDTASGEPTDITGIFFGTMGAFALFTGGTYVKGINVRITPEKVILRCARGHLKILSGTAAAGTTVKSACFKAVLTT